MTGDKERTGAQIARTTAALVDKAHQLEQRVSDVTHRVEQMVDPRARVRVYPWQSVGVALAVGFVLGLLS